jgi:hypothetical protein
MRTTKIDRGNLAGSKHLGRRLNETVALSEYSVTRGGVYCAYEQDFVRDIKTLKPKGYSFTMHLEPDLGKQA